MERLSEFTTPSLERPPGSETILLLEDEPIIRQWTRLMLCGQGYQVLEAASGEEAITLFDQCQSPIHLLLTDVNLPGVSGPAVADRLTASRPEMRVLYITGSPNDVMLQRRKSRRDFVLLPKPFTVDGLSAKVREALGVSCR